MSVQVYILWSPSLGRYYAGFSVDSTRRLRERRRGQTQWTSRADDWHKVWETTVANNVEARAVERRIKARGARRFLEDKQTNQVAPAVPPLAG